MTFFAMLLLLLVPLLLGWLIVDGLRNGVVRMRGGSYSRSDEPAWYWTVIAVYAATLGGFYALGPMIFGVLLGTMEFGIPERGRALLSTHCGHSANVRFRPNVGISSNAGTLDL